MIEADFEIICYKGQDHQVSWLGIDIIDGDIFESFINTGVVPRLYDDEGNKQFKTFLRGLATTGFANDSLDKIIAAEIPEERDWAIGEAIAEAYLTCKHHIIWPWNMARDKRTPKASLPGADLIGFEIIGDYVRLVLGEVKTSGDINTPPNVIYGRSGMIHQIDNLASNMGLINQLLKWLLHRCKGTEYEQHFNKAITLLLNSGNNAVALFGVLIRDTKPNELDLKSRGKSLAISIAAPSSCQLIALHLPCAIADLPVRVSGRLS